MPVDLLPALTDFAAHAFHTASAAATAATQAISATAAQAAGSGRPVLFPLAEVWWVYGLFTILVLGVIALDLGVFHRKAHVVGFREAGIWSAIWVTLALTVNVLFWWWAEGHFIEAKGMSPAAAAAAADQAGLEFFAGYLMEKALAVDNIFVIAMVFTTFAIPPIYQHRVLFWGILGAIVFRAIFISIGAVLMQYHWIIVLAGIFLILTGIKMVLMGDGHKDPRDNPIVKLVRKIFPVTDQLEGEKFFVRRAGVLMVTPLFLALCAVEVTDIIFAIDSVPAIYALTSEPLIVFMSNILAILGLRAMYFLLAGTMDLFHLLKYSLAAILVFVGLKMAWLNKLFEDGKFPIGFSLLIIAALLSAGIALSLIFKKKAEEAPPSAPAA